MAPRTDHPARVARLLAAHEALLGREDWRAARGPAGIAAATLADPLIELVRCTVELGVPAAELGRYLIDDLLSTLAEWNPLYVGGEALEHSSAIGHSARILHLRFRSPAWPIAPRDNLIFVARLQLPDGRLLELSEDEDHSARPPARGTVRMVLPFASKQIEPAGPGRCRYTVIWQTDPAGLIGRLLPAPLRTRAVLNDLIGECRRLLARFPR